MTEELLVGTIGWDHDNWVGDYYSNDLPDDWRFAYYRNDYRSVLVPIDHFRSGDKEAVSEWVEDCDEAFRFVVEVPKTCLLDADEKLLQSFLQNTASLHSFLAGFYVSLGAVTSEEIVLLQTRVGPLQQHASLCIDYNRESEVIDQLGQLVVDNNIGLCWHPDINDAPTAGGALMVALSEEENPKAQRHLIEALETWMQQSHGLAGLFLKTPAAASQARIIAEMLGI